MTEDFVPQQQNTNQKRSSWIFFVLLVLYGALIISLLYFYGDAAFGYDTGIYRRIVSDYSTATDISPVPPFAFGYIANFFSSLGFSLDAILSGGYVAIALATFTLLYRVTEIYTSRRVALIVSILFLTSIVQFDFITWYYYRNVIAMCCLLAAVVLLHKKSHALSIPLILLTSIHPFTAMFVYVTFGIYGVVTKEHRAYLFGHLFLSGSIACVLNRAEFARYISIFIEYAGIVRNASSTVGAELDGQFITTKQYIIQNIMILPFAFYGVWKYAKKYLLWSVLILICLLGIAAELLLYKRLFILLHIPVLFFAALGLNVLYEKIQYETWRYIPVIFMIGYFTFPIISHSKSFVPRIHQQMIIEIEQFGAAIPSQSTILSMSSEEAPWLLGFAGPHTIIAPGVFDANRWSEEEWYTFWTTKDLNIRHTLFDRYEKNSIYIFSPNTNKTHALFVNDPSITQLSPFVWVYQK
ncbi:MAG: hypothetical protein KBD15_00455 [Candidatus Magasanikbacteria bacterium]|nr:hypothetical protein [Candidatus Magasanikbacteria bacterium]